MDRIDLNKIELASWRGEINANYDCPQLRQALGQIPQIMTSSEAEVLLASRNRLVAVNLPVGQGKIKEIVIKEFRPRGLIKLRDWLRGSKARRSFYGALNLIKNQIKTAEPIAYLETVSWRGRKEEYFLATRISQAQEIRFLFQHVQPDQLDYLLIELASLVRQMHDRGLIHRDLSDGNILVRQLGPISYEFFLLDPNRVRLKRKVSSYQRIKNLIRLGLPASKQKFFLQVYFQNKMPTFGWFWYLWAKRSFTFWLKLKKWLRLRSLARSLRWQ
ncbi:MAG: hypothetical protein N3B16_09445 [Candidatus Aminicenantes bacterium]|nr:hypothetical protein [Candidatus Aminicenantes bacterium]